MMVRYARWIYAGWLVLTSVAIVLQFYLAGYGVFGFNGLKDFGPHFLVGDLIGIASLIGIVIAFAARAPLHLVAINAGFAGLMVVQFLLTYAGIRGISALHVVNGVLIFLVTLYLTRESIKLARVKSAPEARPAASGVGATARR